MERILKTVCAEETFRLGKKIGESLKGGEVICLYGELGAGKTVFAKGLGQGLGIEEEITSPTFTMIQEYAIHTNTQGSPFQFVHMDLYRLHHPEEAEVIGVTDYFREDSICLLEWPEIIHDLLPEDKLDIWIEGNGELPRSIKLNYDKECAQLLDSILENFPSGK